MTEPLTTGLLVTLAVQEFIKSGTGDLAKRFTAEALTKEQKINNLCVVTVLRNSFVIPFRKIFIKNNR